ncbi:MAG: hypothetical protein Q9195_009190 [Heterodermia aff. obscurata]
MFVTEPSAGRLSTCLRCQYRFALQENPIWPSFPVPKRQQWRRISQTSRLSQQPAAAHNNSFDLENPDYDTASTNITQKPSSKFRNRRLNLYRRDLLGITSLGRPAEALILHDSPGNSVEKKPKLTSKQTSLSASELLERVDAEGGVIGAQRVAEHLEEIRSSWASRSTTNRKPTDVEFHALKKSISEGFTRLQLAEYYGKDDLAGFANDLSSSYSNNLYTRSEWSPTITEFPGNAAQRLYRIHHIAKQGQDLSESDEVMKSQQELNAAKEFSKESKSTLLSKILRLRWRIQTVEDEERPGQIDIWPRRESLRVLLNHKQNIFEQVSRRFGVKIDASAQEGLIRISGDRATSGDVLKFIIYMLKRICHREVALWLGSRKSRRRVEVGPSKDPLRSAQLQEHLQQITNTIIEPAIASLGSHDTAKVTIHFLGPSADDFQDAKRLLLQSIRSSGSDKATAVFGASQDHTAIAPVPIEVGNGLPFVQRSREWSRWAKVIKRNDDYNAAKIKSQAEIRRKGGCDKPVLLGAVERIEQYQRLLTHLPLESPPLVPHSPHWQGILGQSNSVTIGRVIYPTDVVQQVHKKITAHWEKSQILSPKAWKEILGPHEFLTSLNGLLLSFDENISQERQFLLVKLSPKGKHALLAPLANAGNSPSISKQAPDAPDLEIYLDVDQNRRYIAVKEVRAILNTKKTDLLLPLDSNDLRFVSQQYAISAAALDPKLEAFVNASELALWSSERLKTPSSLVLDVPRFATKDRDQIEHQGPVEYAFTALEHRTQLFTKRDGFQYEYTVIEAGRTGGQREEFRIHVGDQTQDSSEENPTILRQLYGKAMGWIADMYSKPNLATPKPFIRPRLET